MECRGHCPSTASNPGALCEVKNCGSGTCTGGTCVGGPSPGALCCGGANCLGGYVSCAQRDPGAFTAIDVARTIVEIGSPAGSLSVGGLPRAATIVGITCAPPSFSSIVDSAGDLPGPGAVSVPVTVSLN